MFARTRARLRDDTGSVLIDAMVGIIIAAVAIIGLASIAATTTTAITSTVNTTSRMSFLRSYVNELASGSAVVPPAVTAQTVTKSIGSKNVSVTSWQTTVGASTVIHAAVANDGNDPAPCASPAPQAAPGCLRAQVTVQPGGAGIVTTPVYSFWAIPAIATSGGGAATTGSIGTFTPSNTSVQVRFVAKVSAPSVGNIDLTDTNTHQKIGSIPFAANSNGYLYGSVTVSGSNPVDVSLTGSSAYISRFYIYEAPR